MNIKIYTSLLITLLLLSGRADLANADQIYKWTDPDGLTHYSESPPVALTDAETSVKALDIAMTGYPNRSGKDDYYSIINQAKRLEELRLKKEQLKIERDSNRLAKQDADRKNEPVQFVIQQPSYPVYQSAPAYHTNRGNRHAVKHRYRHQHKPSASKHSGIGNSPALQVRAYSGKTLNTTAGLQISFE